MTKVKLKTKTANKNLVKPVVMRSCPFCGVKPKYIEGWHHSGQSKWGAWITCESKRCEVNPQLSGAVSSYTMKKELKVDIIKAWNKRA